MSIVNWLDRRLVPLILGGLAGSVACLILAFVVVLAGCEMKDDSGTDGKTDGRCGELTDGCSP